MTRFAMAFGLVLALATGPAMADDIGAMLDRIALPQGFHIKLFARAPGARAMAVSPDGRDVIVGTLDEDVWRIALAGPDAGAARRFAPKLPFKAPNGPCFGPDGALYLSEFNRIRRFPAKPGGWDEDHPQDVVPEGGVQPASETSMVHAARVCRFGPDGKLYVAIGQPTNVPSSAREQLNETWGLGAIWRMNADGSGREIFARGIRNSVGLDFDPADGVLWFTDNQVDRMGDDIPPGEINRAPKPGLNFGFPWYGGGHVRTHKWAYETPPDVVFPEVEEAAHAADLGMIFYRGDRFPAQWRGIFSAQHGSWDRSIPIGARVMFTPVANGKAGASIPFAEGWNTGSLPYLGRPVDVAETPDGLLVSDDQNGAIYKITYEK
ncbi:sorbosone dehydrogenase [Rhodoblastus sphagnicola]|uniref:Sorbosone dehydrogenase n=1 Tax=Rhodoblastus sphagnicola TaxID=333368 RepID=A0A2S6NFM5_9HYPH|nr:PQQ-dependent sugar dehydrogenase [Rhodoblastus sphagnicola]MBB4199213.1 glucose/arabinose dehydrogenase [Rhodoblastus sphagnicola]PPQ33379.1 sorbosone dehydrogenase [Rhodoblastus sphagnicola]